MIAASEGTQSTAGEVETGLRVPTARGSSEGVVQAGMTKTYAYGARAPIENLDLVRDQLRLAHRYRNRLVEIERARRVAREAAGEDEEAVRAADECAARSVRVARAASGCYWGTYLLVEDAARRSWRTGREPRFRRFDGSGTVAVQLQGGLAVEALVAGEDTRARLVGSGRHRTLFLRVGSDGRAPVWATFPIVYHRDLPSGAVVKWVRGVCRRVGTHYEWSAQFVVVGVPELSLPPPTRGAIAIDVGWRRVKEGARVAAWVDDVGGEGQVVIPDALLARWRKVEELRGIRDRSFNAARDALRAWRAEAMGLPSWFRERTESLHAWRSPWRLAALAIRWRGERFPGDEEAFAAAEAWRKQDKHLYEWEAHQRQNVLRARREIYRVFACFAAAYRRVVVEDLDLRDFTRIPVKRSEDPQVRAPRGRRFAAVLSELLGALAYATRRAGGEWLEAPSAWTTQTCHACGERARFDSAAEIIHRCATCGATWDQDVNAARDLLRAAQDQAIDETRSRRRHRTRAGESKLEAWRARGLAASRASRPDEGGDPAGKAGPS